MVSSVVVAFAVNAEHQARREWPRLTRDVAHVADPDANFFEHFADDGVLECLASLDIPGQRRHPTRWPTRLPTEKAPILVVGHQHDHGWVGSWVVLAAVIDAPTYVASKRDNRCRTAQRAAHVTRVPLLERGGVRQQSGVGVRQRRHQPRASLPLSYRTAVGRAAARRRRTPRRRRRRLKVLLHRGNTARPPERSAGRERNERIVLVDERATPIDDDHARRRVGPRARQPLVVRPQVRCTIDA